MKEREQDGGRCVQTEAAEQLQQDSYKMGFRAGLLRAAEIADECFKDSFVAKEIRKEARERV